MLVRRGDKLCDCAANMKTGAGPIREVKAQNLFGLAALFRVYADADLIDEGGRRGRADVSARGDDPREFHLAFERESLGHQMRAVVGSS